MNKEEEEEEEQCSAKQTEVLCLSGPLRIGQYLATRRVNK